MLCPLRSTGLALLAPSRRSLRLRPRNQGRCSIGLLRLLITRLGDNRLSRGAESFRACSRAVCLLVFTTIAFFWLYRAKALVQAVCESSPNKATRSSASACISCQGGTSKLSVVGVVSAGSLWTLLIIPQFPTRLAAISVQILLGPSFY